MSRNIADSIRKVARVVLIVMVTLAAYINGMRIFVEIPCDKASDLAREISDIATILGKYQSYVEGFSVALELQSTSGQPVAPEVLKNAAALAQENECMLKHAEFVFATVEEEARRENLPVDQMVLLSGRTVATFNRAALAQFRSQVVSIEVDSPVRVLAQHLQEEEAVVARTLAVLARQQGAEISQELWSNICQQRGCVAHILQELQQRTQALSDSKNQMCEKHKQAYCRHLEEIRVKAESLKRRLEEIRRATATVSDSSTA